MQLVESTMEEGSQGTTSTNQQAAEQRQTARSNNRSHGRGRRGRKGGRGRKRGRRGKRKRDCNNDEYKDLNEYKYKYEECECECKHEYESDYEYEYEYDHHRAAEDGAKVEGGRDGAASIFRPVGGNGASAHAASASKSDAAEIRTSSAVSPLGRLVELCPGILPDYVAAKLRKAGMSDRRILGCQQTNQEEEALIGDVADALFQGGGLFPDDERSSSEGVTESIFRHGSC